MCRAAEAKKAEAARALAELELRRQSMGMESATATQRAADFVARAEAHTQEAAVARDQELAARRKLAELERAAGIAGATAAGGAAFGGGALSTIYWGETHPQDAFPYLLSLDINGIQLPPVAAAGGGVGTAGVAGAGMLPKAVLLRIRQTHPVDGVEVRSTTPLPLVGTGSGGGLISWSTCGAAQLPILDPFAPLQIEVLDATGAMATVVLRGRCTRHHLPRSYQALGLPCLQASKRAPATSSSRSPGAIPAVCWAACC